MEGIVLLTNNKTFLKITGEHNENKIIMSEGLINRIKNLEERTAICDKSEISKLAYLLKDEHEEKEIDILAALGINKHEILKGVQCPSCNGEMRRHRKSWECKDCKCRNQEAHKKALEDYALLFSPYIENHAAREFLLVESIDVVKRILINLNSCKTGGKKFRSYQIPLSPLK
ncbi:hypothetical protein [Halobacillus sp. Marseille-Q1614]|uniref:hypothetical protein n=1 Tax=Halobacillus sp. Marseille-Q1614 TaxID=2709134 RepID=UPI00156E59DE|nr:hypothetical protein [Halobacillus sp. Marseille-Q1614]